MGFNMSWIFVDQIEPETLYEALELTPTGEAADPYDLGTSEVPLAGARLKSGWCAIFAKYALIMDLTTGTNPPRIARLPGKCRGVACVVLEHAMISYASLWQGGRHAWEIRHDSRQGREHLEVFGDSPPEFAGIRDTAIDKQRAQDERRGPRELPVDYVFGVPLETAATITEYRHYTMVENDFFKNVQTLQFTDGNVLTRRGQPPKWWQTAGSLDYT
jgi:hypothetical protein